MADPIICPYCYQPAVQVRGEKTWPHRRELFGLKFWACLPCDARVGCHQDGRPLGRLANAAARRARHEAHLAFDRLWKCVELAGYPPLRGRDRHLAQKRMRLRCYAWLRDVLQMPPEEAHIGMMISVPLLKAVAAMAREADPADLRARYAGVRAESSQKPYRQSQKRRRVA